MARLGKFRTLWIRQDDRRRSSDLQHVERADPEATLIMLPRREACLTSNLMNRNFLGLVGSTRPLFPVLAILISGRVFVSNPGHFPSAAAGKAHVEWGDATAFLVQIQKG